MARNVSGEIKRSAVNTAGYLRNPRSLSAVALALCCASFLLVARAYDRSSPESARSKRSAVARPGSRAAATSTAMGTTTGEPVQVLKLNLVDAGIGASGKPNAPTTQVAPSAPIKAVYFRITPLGIEPAQLSLPAGRYLVAIDNDSGFNAVDIKIDKEGGPQLERAQLPSGRRKWRGFVDFTTGRHVLADPSDAKRVCRLTITDQ